MSAPRADERTLHNQGDKLYYALQSLYRIMTKRQMSADEWRDLDSAYGVMREYDELIRAPYAEIRNAERRITQARADLAELAPAKA